MAAESGTEYVFFGVATAAITTLGISGAHAQQDLSGPYAGLSLGMGDSDNFLGYGDEYSFEGAAVGAFAGYNVVNGDWVFGGEVGYTAEYGVDDNGASFYSDMGLKDVIDLRGRVGRVFGDALVYGAGGVSFASVGTSGGLSTSASGLNIGLGFEYSLGRQGFVGGEITHRRLDVDDNLYVFDDSIELNSASIRLGLRF